MRRQRRGWAAVLVGYLLLLGVVGLWATAVDVPVRAQLDGGLAWLADHGVAGVRYAHVEAVANLCLFLPLGALLAGLLPDRPWWVAGPAGLLLSAAVEVAQTGLAGRTPSLRDIALNTAGALLGAALVRLWATLRRTAEHR
ncbi:VanZ family protein [Ornithinimicrobium avium]|uniref:VanZ family protein n=1 Tax=Ornithinimicrobium avium TaxID=2283195 RepID=UPI0013B4301E|nr:VanZ family protein [Ornithinimicrobium avium]